ncbi:hypothetical protein M1M11_30445 [Pseudomonas azerbaijanoccidens]|uniref:hypothetical protein n=1 Tax=Pseudomonas azerbaijanoccidentalis TaxID=2842347 RepID=UPI00200B5815|nr:hypothetical protein [Pseudomonas azerbaijanoccidentalis]MCK8669203.1 hypothetical protein [Pseudomonas azerbaijanoccidentalis]
MALKLNERYPGRFDNPTPGYPQGAFKNRTSPTAKDGSYLEKDWANDKEGFFQSLLSAAGIIPSGSPDEVGNSQYYSAMLNAINTAPILTDTGVANAYTAINTPALAGLPATGYGQRIKITNANTGASTYSPDGLAAKPIYGLGLQPLQGGELPPGIAVLMYLVQAGVNGGNGAWIIMESLGGAGQVAPATKSQHAIQLSQMAAVVGGSRNARMVVAAASATATFTADEVAVKSALGGSAWLLSSINKVINLGATGAGGMDAGAAPANGFVAIYAIYNPTTATSALLAVNATAARQPEVYGGANMPAGYAASALVGVWRTNASGQFIIGSMEGRDVSFVPVQALSTSVGAGTPTILVLSTSVPKNAVKVGGSFNITSAAGSSNACTVQADVNGTGQRFTSQGPGTAISGEIDLSLITDQTLYYTCTVTAAPMGAILTITSFRF